MHEGNAGAAAVEVAEVVAEHALHVVIAVPVQRVGSGKCPHDVDRVAPHHRGHTRQIRIVVVDERRAMWRPEQLHAHEQTISLVRPLIIKTKEDV